MKTITSEELAAVDRRIHATRQSLLRELELLRNLRQIAKRHATAIDTEDIPLLIQSDTELAQCLDELDREFPPCET